jgi:pimeloyl-ACP methyl ester carboxylesterase
MSDLVGSVTDMADYAGSTPAQAWFAGGERVGYDPKARAIVAAQNAPLNIFLRGEGDLAHAVCFLPGFPDGSFGWAKVRPHLPDAAEMPKLFVEYAGMGDSDKPKDYAYSTAERTDLVEAIWRDLPVQSTTLVAFDFPRWSSWSTCDAGLSALSGANPWAGRTYAAFLSSMAGSSRTGTPIRGSPRPFCAASPTGPVAVWAAPSPCSSWRPR